MRQHAKTKQRKMMFTLLKRWKIEKLSRRWANRRRQAEKKKKKNKNSTSSSLPLFPYMAKTQPVSHLCWHRTKWIALDSGRGQRRTAHPKPFASAKCIVRRNLRGTLAHGCQKHASSLHYSQPFRHRPNNLCGWIMNGHADTQTLKRTERPLCWGAPEIYFQSQLHQMLPFLVCLL